MIAPFWEKEDFTAYGNKLIFTRMKGIPMSFYVEGNTLVQADLSRMDESGKECGILNNIYIGKIRNIAKNLNAAFVEYKPGAIGFLSMEPKREPYLLNRAYNGGLSQGDELLVQVEKEPVKTKDAVLTTNLTFSGTYGVLSTERRKIGFSNKLSNRQKEFLRTAFDTGPFGKEAGEFGLIFRTNAGNLTEETIHLLWEEIEGLKKQKDVLFKKAKTRQPFALLYQEKPFAVKKAQDAYLSNIDRIITDDEEMYRQLLDTELSGNLSFYQDELLSLQNLYGLKGKLEEALKKKVWLKSGGYLVIEPTEALTVIDVNSGKCTDKKKRQEMHARVNMEAALEAARQIRLRNLSGIILVDFINLEEKAKEEELISFFREQCRRDPVPTTLVDITPLGLVELTRKKIEAPLHEKCRGLFTEQESRSRS